MIIILFPWLAAFLTVFMLLVQEWIPPSDRMCELEVEVSVLKIIKFRSMWKMTELRDLTALLK
jgi:hypothetical protein